MQLIVHILIIAVADDDNDDDDGVRIKRAARRPAGGRLTACTDDNKVSDPICTEFEVEYQYQPAA